MRQRPRRAGRVTTTAALAAPGRETVELVIEGMTCAACAMRIERTLNKLDGVVASVNFATATARVTAPSAVLTGRLVVRAVNVGRDTQLAQLIRLVEQAQAQKAAVQRTADRISGVFVPAVLAAAAATLAGWLLAGARSTWSCWTRRGP
jgi:cation transport ATPase